MIRYDEIEESIRIEEVLDELGIRVTDVRRGEHFASCPLPSHPGADSQPSFSVNERNLLWHCFTCNDGGKLPLLIVRMNGYEDIHDGYRAWDQAVEWLISYSDGPTNTDEGFLKQVEALLQAPVRASAPPRRPALPFFSDKGFRDLPGPPVALLEPWNLTQETASEFDLHYDEKRIRRRSDREYVGPAIVIPHRFRGRLVGWQDRWLGERPVWLPKYTNTDDFPKGLTLFGYDLVVNETRPVIVVESGMTVMRLRQLGYPAVGTFGASVTEAQIRLLRGFTNGLWIAFDNDPDFLTSSGRWVKGAGFRSRDTLLQGLCDYVPVDVIPPPAKEKGDLADVEEDEIHRLIGKRKAGFLLLPST